MSESPFVPKAYQESQFTGESARPAAPDKIGAMILKVEQYIVIALLFLIPAFFVPGLPASLGFDKVLLSTVLGLSVVVLAGLSALRYSKVSTVLPASLGVFWLVVIAAFASGALSGDLKDAFQGSVFEAQTAGFLMVMGLLMTVPLVLQRSKQMSLKALMFFGAGAVLVLLYNLVRIIFGGDFLTLNSFGSATVSMLGGFNDLAIFSALVIILSLITLLQLPLKKLHQAILAAVSVVALAVMATVNFFSLWVIVGFFALLLLVYIFSRDTLFSQTGESKVSVSPALIFTTILVCIVSIVFVVAGEYLGSKISSTTNINYLEVRPSVTATLDIAKDVYRQDAFLGIGPNKFVDAWRLYKDPSINETIFWSTNFNAGFGFVPTLFITLGLLGSVCLLAFQALYLRLGYRMLLRSTNTDSFWYFFGLTTFVSATFLWLMSYLYVSGPALMLLTALFTGLSFSAYQALVPQDVRVIPLVSNRKRGFLLMTLVILVIIGSVSSVFTMSKQYVAQATFTKARTTSTTPAEFQQLALQAYQQFADDTFLTTSARTRVVTLRGMMANTKPSEADQEKFVAEARQAVLEAEEAIKIDDSNPDTHAALADILIILSAVGFEDAKGRAEGKLEDAKWRDPFNPIYEMAGAMLAAQLNDSAAAREKIGKALTLKRNYSEALFLLTQIDVKDGNIDNAINTSRQIVTIEPNNPTRYYQLGVLLAAKKDLPAAIQAYEAAITLDSNFANARYMLALTYLDSNRTQDALTQLRIVQETNKENTQLADMITKVENGTYAQSQTNTLEGAVNEAAPGQEGGAVTAPGDPNTDLVSPVNTVSAEQEVEPAPEQ